MKKKTLWILTMFALSLVLYTIVLSRMENSATIIFGGSEGGFVRTDGINFADTNVTPEPVVTEDIWPKLTTKDFEDNTYLQIVNNNNLLSSAYEPEVSKIERTRYMMYSTEYMPYLDAFLDAIEAAGLDYFIAGAYRSYSYQAHVYNSKASQIAYEMAGGKQVDYTDPIYQEAEDMNQELFKWLDEHCAEYGFIKRYPTRKLLLTGWDEPWHYRYVGREVATFIMEQGLCYEEFYAHYFPDFEY